MQPQQPTAQQQQTQAVPLPVIVAAAAALAMPVFAQAQAQLLTRSAALVRDALTSPSLFPSLPAALAREARATAYAVRLRIPAIVDAVITRAGYAGAATGERIALRAGAPAAASLIGHQPNSVAMIARDLIDQLTAAANRITRFSDDAYRAAVAMAAARQVAGELVPHAAQEAAWRDLMGQGITGFTDRAGRDWNLATYTEMAVRTAAARAYRDSSQDRMTQMGLTFFTVSGTGRPCPLCAPWEGKVLSSLGAGTYQEDGHPVVVAATVEEATAAGLFHPNCKHTLTAYTPGVTLLKPVEWTAEAEAEYQATQRLRALERAVRAAKQQADAAVTPDDKTAANARVRAGQAAIRAHVDATGLNRRRQREQVDLGFKEQQ